MSVLLVECLGGGLPSPVRSRRPPGGLSGGESETPGAKLLDSLESPSRRLQGRLHRLVPAGPPAGSLRLPVLGLVKAPGAAVGNHGSAPTDRRRGRSVGPLVRRPGGHGRRRTVGGGLDRCSQSRFLDVTLTLTIPQSTDRTRRAGRARTAGARGPSSHLHLVPIDDLSSLATSVAAAAGTGLAGNPLPLRPPRAEGPGRPGAAGCMSKSGAILRSY